MKRAKLILGVSAVMMAMLIALAAPAMADDFGVFGDFEQEAESGDIDQSFDVTGRGDNANQTVNASGVDNTGNLQTQFGFTQIGSDIDEFEIDDVGSSLEVSGGSDVSSEQKVNQAASSK